MRNNKRPDALAGCPRVDGKVMIIDRVNLIRAVMVTLEDEEEAKMTMYIYENDRHS